MTHVRFGSKADMCSAKRHVRFAPESGHVRRKNKCPLSANSGHLLTPAGQLCEDRLGTQKYLQADETGQIVSRLTIATLGPVGKSAPRETERLGRFENYHQFVLSWRSDRPR